MLKEKLIEIRKISGLNQTQFAEKVGCSMQHISQIERGVSKTSFNAIQEYAGVFGLELTIGLEVKKK